MWNIESEVLTAVKMSIAVIRVVTPETTRHHNSEDHDGHACRRLQSINQYECEARIIRIIHRNYFIKNPGQ
jgi:hypothetical protein